MAIKYIEKPFSPTVQIYNNSRMGWIRKRKFNRIEERSPRIEDLILKGEVTTKSGIVDFGSTSPLPTGETVMAWKTKYKYWQEALDMFIIRRCIEYVTIYQRCTTDTAEVFDVSVQPDLAVDLGGNLEIMLTKTLTHRVRSNAGIGDWMLDSIEINDEGMGISNVTATLKTYGLWEPVQIYEAVE